MSTLLSQITQGLVRTVGMNGALSFSSMLTDGVPSYPPVTPVPTVTDSAMSLSTLVPSASISQATLLGLQSQNKILDTQGRPVGQSPLSTIDLGGGAVLSFNGTTLDARMVPYLDPLSSSGNQKLYDDSGISMFTASDCRVMVEVPQAPVFNGSAVTTRVAKQLLESTTLSVSIHRSKSPVRAFGYANPKGFARGSRTIAGTMVMSKMTAEVLYRFLQSELMADLTKDTVYTKLDQIPPIDFTLMFSNEFGYVSTQRLLGVEFVTDGSVVSVQDALMEQQITWMAADFTPLVPLNFNTFFGVNTTSSNAIQAQRTPATLAKQQNQSVPTSTPSTSSQLFNPTNAGFNPISTGMI